MFYGRNLLYSISFLLTIFFMNKSICIFLFLFFQHLSLVKSQTPDWEWGRSATNYGWAGLPAYGEGIDMVTDANGNIYCTGYFGDAIITFGSVTLTGQNPYGSNIFLVKYDSTGTVLWAKKTGGTGLQVASDISSDLSGNLYITGYFKNQITFVNDTLSTTGTDLFLVKYDSSGNALWAKKANGNFSNAISNSVSADPFGNVYITGSFDSTLVFGTDTLTSLGNADIFTAKYDSSGNALWAKSGNGTLQDIAFSVSADAIGNVSIIGFFSSPYFILNSDTLFNTGTAYAIFLVKFDSTGNVIFVKNSTGGYGNYGRGITTSSYGNIFATGHFNGFPIIFDSDTLFPSGQADDGFLVKYNSSGNVLWAKSFWGAMPYNIIVDSIENVYITGSMGGIPGGPVNFDSFTLAVPSGSYDPMFIAKFDATGSVLWAKALASGGDDQNGIALGPKGGIYITSDFYMVDSLIFGCDTLFLTGDEAFFLAKLGHNACPDSLSELSEVKQDKGVQIFPNPFHSNLTITSANNLPLEIYIYDLLSKNLFRQKFINTISLNTNELAKGIYFYEIKNKNELIRKGKVVRQ